MSVPSRVHVPYSFTPADQTKDVCHTTPFFTTQIRKQLVPTMSEPYNIPRIEGRMHPQGKLYIDMHPTWHTAVPGYTGHIRGKIAENVYGGRYMLENEKAFIKVKERRPSSNPTELIRTRAKIDRPPPETWKKKAKIRWKQCSHGMTHQPPQPPFGFGDKYRQKLAEKEYSERVALKKAYDHATTTVRTWAANQPQHERDHNLWRTGIMGYTGHYPSWKREKEFYEKREIGKVHPPYCPQVEAYSCFVQPPETPKPGVDKFPN